MFLLLSHGTSWALDMTIEILAQKGVITLEE